MLRETRLRIVHGVLVAFAVALVVRSGWVQLWQGETWERLAARQQYAQSALPAPRGEILDVAGMPLAQSQVQVRLNVVPKEVKEPRRLARSLQRLGVDRATLRRVADQSRKWVPISRTFLPSDVATITAMPGVRPEAVVDRHYVPSEGIRRVVGRTNGDGVGTEGLESMLDSLLRGERGSVRALLGPGGVRYESPEALTHQPRPGHSVTLTLSFALQDICDRALADAMNRLDASGGDIVVLDPRDGEVRCLTSRRAGKRGAGLMALIEPFEPGSTLKPLFAGALIESGRARADEVIETYNGVYRTHGRTITDVHKADRLSLADVIRHSSNVGIVRFTERLAPREMYELLRDFGFGTPTGISFPAEDPGRLPPPRTWDSQSHASLAIGYFLSVTPIQLAAAYGAIANDGVLLVPSLVKSITDPDGEVVYEHRPQAVRRVLEARTARTLREILASVVDSGTATDAAIAAYSLGGKSGTARRSAGGRYASGSYTSTFVGLFPADEPQYVVLVKIDNPRGTYYGGKAAAPVAKAIIESALAARGAAVDRAELMGQQVAYVPPPVDAPAPRTVFATRSSTREGTEAAPVEGGDDSESRYALVDSVTDVPPTAPARFDLRGVPPESDAPRGSVTVPDVRALPLRVAARELHRAGLRVAVVGGANFALSPPPGSVVPAGSLVRIGRR